jgi:hypothetical protein
VKVGMNVNLNVNISTFLVMKVKGGLLTNMRFIFDLFP